VESWEIIMGFFEDTITLYKRELLIYKANLRTNLLRALIFPLIMLIIFGNLGNSVKGVPIEIVNYANNPKSVQFINTLQEQNVVSVKSVTTEYQALKDLSAGKVDVVVVILPGFPGSSSITTSSSPSIYVYYTNNYVNLGSSLQQIGSSASEFGATANVALQQGFSSSTVEPPQSTVTYNPAYGTQGSYQAFIAGGLIGMVVVFGSMFGGGMTIIMDRELGNLKAFLITPVERTALVMSKIFIGTTTSLINAIMMLGIIFVFGIHIAMGFVGIAWIIVLTMIAAFGFSAITAILASRINKVEVYAIAAQTITLPLWFASGAFSPISALPSWLQPISKIDPLTYATIGIRDVMLNGYYPLNSIVTDVGILVGFAIVATIISIKMFKTRVE
jgi:ABC-type multidrug transport system permease subunit